jgi:hypothetical protein
MTSIHPNEDEQKRKSPDPLGRRVLIGRLIRKGIEPPVFVEPDILIEASLHWLYGDSESGKTWLALWLVKQRIEAGQRVVYLDCENGPEVIGERLELLGCDPTVIDQHLAYYEEPDLQLDRVSIKRILRRIEEINPALTIFDSTRGFLTAAGLEESSNDDLDKFYALLLKPIRSADRTTVVLDHTGHTGNHARGAKRKRDMCDVMFRIESTGFDETEVGEVKLTRQKGRRGHIPYRVTFSAGGGEAGFVFKRSDGTISDGSLLTDRDREAYDYILAGGENGVSYKALLDHMGGSKSTVSRATNKLLQMKLIRRADGRYYAKGPLEPNKAHRDGEVPDGFHETLEPQKRIGTAKNERFQPVPNGFQEQVEPVGRGGSNGSTSLGVEPLEPARPGSGPDGKKESQPGNGVEGKVPFDKRHSQGGTDSVPKEAKEGKGESGETKHGKPSPSLAEARSAAPSKSQSTENMSKSKYPNADLWRKMKPELDRWARGEPHPDLGKEYGPEEDVAF